MAKKEEEKKEDKEVEQEDATPEVDVGGIFKSLGLGGLVNGLSGILEKVADLAEKGEQLSKSGEFRVGGIPPGVRGGRKGVKGVYGFTINTMAGGKPKVETFGNIKKTPKGPVVEEVREPIVDIFDEGETIKVIAELPGIKEDDVQIEVKGDMLTLSAQGRKRKYNKEILLPAMVDEKNISSSYENAMLEVILQKKEK